MKQMLYPLIIGILVTTSCGDRKIKSNSNQGEAFPATFSEIRDRILIPHCANCHESVISHSLLVKQFVKVSDATDSELYEVVESGEMPISYDLLDEEIVAIKTWIDNGAKND